MSKGQVFKINDVNMLCLNIDRMLQPPEKANNYSYMLLFKTKCGRHLIGNKRGDQWRYKCDVEGDEQMVDLPDKYEVVGWIGLD